MSVINTNVKALAAQASMSNVEKKMQASMERLSTGSRINSAKDDAAGLAITNRMTAQIRGYAVAIRNSNDGISMTQTAEGALGQVTDMLQRMRELSVQAVNGSMSPADRASLQLEVDQMKAEINNVATKTNHNNIKLLDGSAGKITLQTGVNNGDTMAIGFGSVKTKDIGEGGKPSLSSVGARFSTAATSSVNPATGLSGAIYNGDLVINGVVVGASLETDDKLSSFALPTDPATPNPKAASAIAKAAAINSVSADSGVTATVGKTTAYGSAMAVNADADPSTITINGWETATITIGTDLEINRLMVATAINNISAQTGVVATNTHDDIQGIVLQAADGRNIEVDFAGEGGTGDGSFIAADLGLSAQGTYIGTYELNSKDGTAITLSSETDGAIQNAGLSLGTFLSNTATMVSMQRSNAAAAAMPSITTTGLLNGNTLVLNGVGIDAAIGSDDDASNTFAASSTKAASAIAIAAAINKKSDMTGVSAVAQANVVRGTGFTAEEVTVLNINGVAIDINLDANSNRDDVLVAINKFSGQTGVVATGFGAGVQLTAADGRNISIGSDADDEAALGLTGMTIGTDAADGDDLVTFYAQVKLESDKEFDVASGSEGNTNFNLLGFTRGTFGGADNGLKVSDVDISNVTDASAAIAAIDAALENVSKMQATAGAYQNRLESVVSNLTESNQNMSASRSRILDTDYATETTSLARSQIISQAATAMLAQANQSAQSVLSLLK